MKNILKSFVKFEFSHQASDKPLARSNFSDFCLQKHLQHSQGCLSMIFPFLNMLLKTKQMCGFVFIHKNR